MIASQNNTLTEIQKYASAILILLSLNLFSINMGYASPTFMRFCGLVFLVAILIKYIITFKKNAELYGDPIDKRLFIAGASLIWISFLALISTEKPELWITCLIVFICGLNLLIRSAGYIDLHLPALALGSMFYLIFYIFYQNDPFVWKCATNLSHAITAALGQIVGTAATFGPTISGLPILLSFFCFFASFFILSEKNPCRPTKALIAALVGSIVLYAVFLATAISIWDLADKFMDRTSLVFFVLLIPFIAFVWRVKIQSVDLGFSSPSREQAAILALLFLAISLISVFPYYNTGSTAKVLIYEKDSEMGFEIPHFPQGNRSFAPDDGFSVGAIKLYLENAGCKVDALNSTDSRNLKEALDNANVLMLLNLKKAFSPTDQETIQEFVRDGNSLLVFGEHTSMFTSNKDFSSGRDYLNDLLGPTGIQINPDTADYIPDHWLYAASALPHAVTNDLDSDLTTSSVGASLNLSGTARPLIVGRYAFSDRFDQNQPGHLGNRIYERGETLGDLVVAACDTYGDGKVLVFGDTSYIFNNELPFRFDLIYNSISWLMSRELDYANFISWTSAIFLLAIFAIAVGKHRPRITAQFLTCIALAVALSLVASASLNGHLISAPEHSEADLAWIDHTHLNQFNLENYQDDGIAGLTLNLFRNGFLPQVCQTEKCIQNIFRGAASIIIAPNKHYTAKEASMYREFVEDGGLLMISAGYKSADSLDLILRSFGLQIGDLPLGSFPWIEETHATGGQSIVSAGNLKQYWHRPKFMEAYPVMAEGEYKPIAWMRYNGNTYNLIIEKKVGKGRVILIGDSRFLLNENLEQLSRGTGKETRTQYQLQWFGNIELLRRILTENRVGMA